VTVFEHAMVGVTGTVAAGQHRRFGWPVVAAAALVAVLPDWDGVSILFGGAAFDKAHRVWGHNLLVAGISGAAVMAIARLYFPFEMLSRSLSKNRWRREAPFAAETPQNEPTPGGSRIGSKAEDASDAFTGRLPLSRPTSASELWTWVTVGLLASLSHLAADLVYSGHHKLADWGIQLLWPFSDRPFAYPVVPWGDVGATLIFVVTMFAMVRWKSRAQIPAALGLASVVGYVTLRRLL
jgi:hypothetical protein